MRVEIDKEVLFDLIKSHSSLAEAEYNRNPSFNDEHSAAKAEQGMIKELQRLDILEELLNAL